MGLLNKTLTLGRPSVLVQIKDPARHSGLQLHKHVIEHSYLVIQFGSKQCLSTLICKLPRGYLVHLFDLTHTDLAGFADIRGATRGVKSWY